MKRIPWLWLGLFVLFLLAGGWFAVYVHFKSRRDFIASLLPNAKQLEDLTGIKAPITLAQAGLESGDGNSDLVQKYHNIFGIKAGKSWSGAVAAPTATHEVVEGIKILVTEKSDRSNMFRAYANYYAAMQDWASLLARLYPDAYAAAKAGDIQRFAAGLQRGVVIDQATGIRARYATDPGYPALLAGIFPVAREVASA